MTVVEAKAAVEQLLRKLDVRDLVGYLEEERLGGTAYRALISALNERALTKHQTANALVVLHRLRAHGSDEEVFTYVVRGLEHDSERVRNQAARLAVGMMRAKQWAEPFYTDETRLRLAAALARGLDVDGANLVRLLLEQGPAAVALK